MLVPGTPQRLSMHPSHFFHPATRTHPHLTGQAESVVGQLTTKLKLNSRMFLATKVWTEGESLGLRQIKESMSLLKRRQVELYQIHNLVDWKTQFKTLRNLQEKGIIRYIGITHYTPSAFDDIIRVMKREKIDFIQIPYSIVTTQAESKILPLAFEKGIGVIPNQTFEQGRLFKLVKGRALPPMVEANDISSWAQLFLKYVLSHPSVTCVIPGTSKVKHVKDNIRAGYGSYFNPGEIVKIRKIIKSI